MTLDPTERNLLRRIRKRDLPLLSTGELVVVSMTLSHAGRKGTRLHAWVRDELWIREFRT